MTARKFEAGVRECWDSLPSGRIIVGLSGGADSVALLSALAESGRDVIATHCNFNLRGEESLRDLAHSEEICRILGVQLRVISFQTREYAAANGLSIETACRELRYRWFEELRQEVGALWIAVAHHREDNNETLLLNLFRGTGLRGLKAMKPVTGHIVRPLLGITRKEIEAYLEEKGLQYVTDSSNLSNDFARNKVRNLVMPLIRSLFPDADTTIALSASNLAEANRFVEEMIVSERQLWVSEKGDVDVEALSGARTTSSFILFSLIRDEGYNYAQAKDIIEAARQGLSGRIFISSHGTRRLLDRGTLLLKPDCDSKALRNLTVERVPRSSFMKNRPAEMEFFSLKVLEGAPLEVRSWRHGDRLRPFGMNGTRLVSDILSDRKIDLDAKKNVAIVTKGDTLLWVVGMRRSAYYPVEDDAEDIVRITVSE